MGLKRKIFKIEIVEKPITDATAIPSDVRKDKVFYNNDGRQIGSGILLNKSSVTIITGKNTETLGRYNSDISVINPFFNSYGDNISNSYPIYIVSQIQLPMETKFVEMNYQERNVVLYREKMGLPRNSEGFAMSLSNQRYIMVDPYYKILYELKNENYVTSGEETVTIDYYY